MFSINYKILGFILILLFAGCSSSLKKNQNQPAQPAAHSLGIIPLPSNIKFLTGNLVIDKNTKFVSDDNFVSANKVINNVLNQVLSDRINSTADTTGKVTIRYVMNNTLNVEGYQIHISDKGIELIVKTPRGAFYAAQTLSQMIWHATHGIKNTSIKLACVNISDTPKYAYRGFQLDVARHFFSKEFLMRIIDWLSYYKINKFQLHLTDDQGWRIEISQYPSLTKIGAWRTFDNNDSICMEKAQTDPKYTIDNRFIKVINGKTVYGGYYSKQDIREIVKYAREHFIDIIPEIDMPGHMSAAIRAYPFLSCTGSVGWGKEFSYPISPCKDSVMNFCHSVWDEITELFPSTTVHIGGDEVDRSAWAACPECQNFMLKNNLHSTMGIQNYFVSNIQHYLESKGKTVIAWDDVMDGKVDKNLIIMYWRDWLKDIPEKAASNGNSIILTPWTIFYLSSENDTDESLKDLYNYDLNSVFASDVVKKVIGLQGCVWTEEIPSEAMFEYRVFPRLQALSEVEWGTDKNWNSFKIRLETHLKYMDSKHIIYRNPTWATWTK